MIQAWKDFWSMMAATFRSGRNIAEAGEAASSILKTNAIAAAEEAERARAHAQNEATKALAMN